MFLILSVNDSCVCEEEIETVKKMKKKATCCCVCKEKIEKKNQPVAGSVFPQVLLPALPEPSLRDQALRW